MASLEKDSETQEECEMGAREERGMDGLISELDVLWPPDAKSTAQLEKT